MGIWVVKGAMTQGRIPGWMRPLIARRARLKEPSASIGALGAGALLWTLTANISAAEDLPRIETVVVTAQRYETNIKDAPLSMEVIDGEALQRRNLVRLSEALKLVPNVYVYDDGGSFNTAINIRGIGNEIPFTEPATSVFINGIPFSGNLSDFDLPSVERIEILRGAQSTLYGQNTLAGAINVVTKSPSTEAWSNRLRIGAGNLGQREWSASLNGPLARDKVGVALDFGQTESDGYLSNTSTGNDETAAQENLRFRGVLDYAISDTLDGALSVDLQRDEGAKTDAIERDEYSFARVEDPREERDSDQVALNLIWRLGDLEFASITGYRNLTLDLNDVMVQVLDSDTLNRVATEEEELFQEFRLVKPKSESSLGWQFGAFFSDKTFDLLQDFEIPLFATTQSFDHKQASLRGELYGQVDWEFVPSVTLTVGGRLSRVRREVDHRYAINGFPLFETGETLERDFDNTAGRIALSYDLNSWHSLYASFSQGYKPGTARSGATSESELFLPSEETDTYEIGARGGASRFTYGLSLFYTDYKNRHTFFNGGAIPVTEAVPDATARGAELTLTVDASEDWSFYGRAGYLDTEFGRYVPAGSMINIEGNVFRDTPEWSAAVGTDIRFPLAGEWELYLNADLSYRDSMFGNVSNIELSENPSVTLLDSSIGLIKDRVELAVSAQNLLDRYYFVTTAISNGTGAPGSPRSWLLSAAYRF